jgi:glucose/arabinose dehydrogenase
MNRNRSHSFLLAALIAIALPGLSNELQDSTVLPGKTNKAEVKLILPDGFTSTNVFTSSTNNRHIAVHPNGTIYVKLGKLKNQKGILVLRDNNNDGKLEEVSGFGSFTGTGIAIKNGYLFASSDEEVFRYKLDEKGNVISPASPEKIVTGLVNKRQHASKSIALDNNGNIYVNIGAPSNSCQEQDRTKGSKGMEPCPILEQAGGIWQFKADKLNQSYADGTRYVTGIRNIVGLDWNNEVNELFAVQHGRDDLNRLYPEMFTQQQSAELPAEELFLMKKGSDFGWPYCYFDGEQNKKVLAPEYGGDGKQTGRCSDKDQPIMAFPGHWGPNALLFYTGDQFPEKYKHGAFVAFHGSWNRSPQSQKGYNVVFVPFKDGKPSGDYEIFANGFTGAEEIASPGQAEHRPCGLAQGSDGSLYISDSVKGTIWKISYKKS